MITNPDSCPEAVVILNWKKNLFWVWMAQFLSLAGFNSILPFVPFYIEKLGVHDHQMQKFYVAAFATIGNISFCLFSPLWGMLADKYGRRLMMLRANIGSAIILPLMAFVPGIAWLLILRFAAGAFAGTITAAQTLISGNTPMEKRGFAIGTVISAMYCGAVIGAFTGGVIADKFGFTALFLSCGLLQLGAALIVYFFVEENFQQPEAAIESAKTDIAPKLSLFAMAWPVLVLLFIVAVARQFDAPFMPMLVEKINGHEGAVAATGFIAGLSAVAGIFSGAALGWLADRTSPQRVAIICALFAGLLMLPQGLTGSLYVLAACRFSNMFFAGGLDPLMQVWLAKTTPDSKRGGVFGWAASARSGGWVIGSILSGIVAVSLDIRWVFILTTIPFLLLIPLIYFVAKKHWQQTA
jgi:DHA1 family multidrug resistance protein-like MFS transporter